MLVEAVRPAPRPADVDIVIGMRGPIAPPEMCNGLMVPIVGFDQIYSFDIDALVKSIPDPANWCLNNLSQRLRNFCNGSCRWPTTRERPMSTAR